MRLAADYNALRTAQNMFERYEEEARRAIFFAAWEARQAGSVYIEPEHLLLSLTHDADSKANQLFSLAAHVENFRRQLRSHASCKIFHIRRPSSVKRRQARSGLYRARSRPSSEQADWHRTSIAGLAAGKQIRRARRPSQKWESIFTQQEIGSEKISGIPTLTANQTTKKLRSDLCDRSRPFASDRSFVAVLPARQVGKLLIACPSLLRVPSCLSEFSESNGCLVAKGFRPIRAHPRKSAIDRFRDCSPPRIFPGSILHSSPLP